MISDKMILHEESFRWEKNIGCFPVPSSNKNPFYEPLPDSFIFIGNGLKALEPFG